MKKKAFTLIELIAVLVIMAILALIVTPLVMNIIRKARIAADKRSIDAYGRSIELAIANYLLDNGDFPTSINDLTIEYSGDEVVCSLTQLNDDSSVYLTGCTVGGRLVDYEYGSDKTPSAPTYESYEVGDQVRYNNEDYYVINTSSENENYVTVIMPVDGNLFLDGVEVNTTAYKPIGTSGFKYAYLHINAGMHHMRGDKEFGLIGYGYSPYISYLYPIGLDLKKINNTN